MVKFALTFYLHLTMSKSTHFIGQPLYSQITKNIDKSGVLRVSRELGGERYIKSFDAWTHLVVMLYAILNRFDSLREITVSMQAEARKLTHLGIANIACKSTLSDANRRRSEEVFGAIYRGLYARYHHLLSSDSRQRRGENMPKWFNRLKIIDSTTITLFSNLVFKGVGRHPKIGKKKGGVKVHTVIHANEGVPADVRFTSAATHDSFMLIPSHLSKGDIIAMDRAYINYAKFEEMTQRGVIYVTKMKKNLVYKVEKDTIYQTEHEGMEVRVQQVTLRKELQKGEAIKHRARIITYADIQKHRLISLLTNDLTSDPDEIIKIYQERWAIELLFKQLKQNFPLRYFYGESANAIKIQVWVTLIANLLLMVMKHQLDRSWSFSGLSTMVRITLMYYVNFYSLFNHPEKDWEKCLKDASEPPKMATLFD